MKEFSSYYYIKAQERSPGDYCDVGYFEPDMSVQKNMAIQVFPSRKISCDPVQKSTLVKNHE